MANKSVFKSKRNPQVDAVNEAGGVAYSLDDNAALAQLAVTGTFSDTYYATAEAQVDEMLTLCKKVEPEFTAKLAVYARQSGYMKDTPAFLCAYLCAAGRNDLLRKVFPKVIDNGRMLRNFVQIIRSGVLGRKSFGYAAKTLIQDWLAVKSDLYLFNAAVGNDPSLADIIKMVHPRPSTKAREALYGYLLGKEYGKRSLPKEVKAFEKFKAGKSKEVPDVSFQYLTALDLDTEAWTEIAKNAKWMMTRMNLNTFYRHGVFGSKKMVKLIADRLRDPELVKKARAFPYQLLMAYLATAGHPYETYYGDANEKEMPTEICEALQDAMEIATENVPAFGGQVYVFPDVSGSMQSPATSMRGGATSVATCVDIAALVAATVLRNNKNAKVIPFEQRVCRINLNPRDSVMTNAKKLASIGGGGTCCSAPLALLNSKKAEGDLLIYVSDNQSWVENARGYGYRDGTSTMEEFRKFKKRNPKAKMVCIDLQPYTTAQAKESKDILNIGGFSDTVWDIIRLFANDMLTPEHWVGVVEATEL